MGNNTGKFAVNSKKGEGKTTKTTTDATEHVATQEVDEAVMKENVAPDVPQASPVACADQENAPPNHQVSNGEMNKSEAVIVSPNSTEQGISNGDTTTHSSPLNENTLETNQETTNPPTAASATETSTTALKKSSSSKRNPVMGWLKKNKGSKASKTSNKETTKTADVTPVSAEVKKETVDLESAHTVENATASDLKSEEVAPAAVGEGHHHEITSTPPTDEHQVTPPAAAEKLPSASPAPASIPISVMTQHDATDEPPKDAISLPIHHHDPQQDAGAVVEKISPLAHAGVEDHCPTAAPPSVSAASAVLQQSE